MRGQRTGAEIEQLRALYERLGPTLCREFAQTNQVDAMVGAALETVLPHEAFSPAWRDALDANETRVRALVAALAGVVQRLEAAGIRSAVVEGGGVLLATALPMRAYCPSDLDLLVDHSATPHAIEQAFAAEGFPPAHRRHRGSPRQEFQRDALGGGTQWLEAGAVPFDRLWVPLSYCDRSEAWLSHRVSARQAPTVHVLEPTDALVFVALHTSMHSFVRAPGIRLHTDVDRIVRDTTIRWDRFIGEARRTGLPTRAFVSLSMARGLLGTPVPDMALRALAPSRARSRALRELLERESVWAGGQPKLRRGRTLVLDALLHEGGPVSWLRSVIFPNRAWMKARFANKDELHAPLWKLHARRWHGLLTRWRPQ